MIYLDNAATTFPKPLGVVRSVTEACKYGVNPGRSGYKSAMNASENIFLCRQKAADFFKLHDVENCILTPSCTVSLNTVIYGVLSKGDHVVISSFEHNSVLRPIKKLSDKGIITYSVAECFEADDDKTVDSFRKCINDKTKLVICTQVSNVFGIQLSVARIGALCKYYGVLFCVDAAQGAGGIVTDINELGADFIACPGHKGLYGPMGTGLLLINTDKIPDSLYQGGTGSSNIDFSEPSVLPDKFESGTLNYSGFFGLAHGINFVLTKGIDNISSYEFKLINDLYSKIKSIKDVTLYTKKPTKEHHAPLLSFNIGDMDSVTVADILDKKYGICVRAGYHCSPLAHKTMGTQDRGTVRISPSVFTTQKEINLLVNAVFHISKYKN